MLCFFNDPAPPRIYTSIPTRSLHYDLPISLYRPARIKRGLPDVQPGTIYNAAVFRDVMGQLDSLPGLKARAILKPGAQYGSSDMMVRVEEDPFLASTAIDNYGRENLGEFRLSATATLTSPELGIAS